MTKAPKRIWAIQSIVVQARRWRDTKPVAGPGSRLLDDYRAYVRADIADYMLAALKFARPFMLVANFDSSQDLIGPIDAAIAKAKENDQ